MKIISYCFLLGLFLCFPTSIKTMFSAMVGNLSVPLIRMLIADNNIEQLIQYTKKINKCRTLYCDPTAYNLLEKYCNNKRFKSEKMRDLEMNLKSIKDAKKIRETI